ncbi:hypothetical protein E0198_004954 [Clavispora lusitaniae]|nr:hypothetical protein E0198_004954 [Clavispora lusitaniae]
MNFPVSACTNFLSEIYSCEISGAKEQTKPTSRKRTDKPTSPMQKVRWKKLLYLRQPYPDNYTDASFLDQLKRNSTVAKYSYRKLFADFSVCSLYGSLLLLVNVNFTAIYSDLWRPPAPTLLASAFSLLVLLADVVTGRRHKFKAYAVLLSILLLVSPVLRSLTESTSSDSIWALSCFLTCLNAACHKYALDPTQPYHSILSTNLSFANGIVLASRLSSSTSVFCFLVFSIEVSVLMPVFDYRLRQNSQAAHYVLLAVVMFIVSSMLYVVHGALMVFLYLLGIVFVSVFLPLYFVFLQKYKNELQGPWDTAKPILKNVT